MESDTQTSAASREDRFHNEEAWIATGFMKRDQPAPFPAAAVPHSDTPESRFVVDWVDQHHVSLQAPDPTYPSGCAIDVALDAPRACRLALPYPAARCGMWVVTCRACGYIIALATAGRSDDPASVRLPCRLP